MKIKPIFTEKSIKEAKNGKYSFWVLPSLNKNQIKTLIEKTYQVKVGLVRTLNYKKIITKNMRGKIAAKPAAKKVVLTLKSGKIDVFDNELKDKNK